MDLATIDIDRDGVLDLVVPHAQENSVSVLRGDRDETFEMMDSIPMRNVPRSARVGDFDGDGVDELAITGTYDRSSTVFRIEDGKLSRVAIVETPRVREIIAAADFDLDGPMAT